MALVLGIDLGTTSVKTSLFNVQSGQVLATLSRNTEASLPAKDPSHFEQCPAQIVKSFLQCLEGFDKEHLSQVGHIAICGQMHGVLLWKSHEEKSTDIEMILETADPSELITWQDGRCDEAFLRSLPNSASRVKPASGYGALSLAWMAKYESEKLTRYERAGTIMDFLVCILTGLKRRVQMSRQNASSWGYFDEVANRWETDSLCSALGIPEKLLPDIVPVGSQVGELLVELCGIKPGTRVSVALGDMQCSFRATLSSDVRNAALLNFSTSCQLAFVCASSEDDCYNLPSGIDCLPDHVEFRPYREDNYVCTVASLNGGNVLQNFVDNLIGVTDSLLREKPASDAVWARLLKASESAAHGQQAQDVIVDPCLFGERHEPDRRGTITNIGPGLIDLGQVFNALCTGLVVNLARLMPAEALKEAGGVELILGSGQCLERIPALKCAIEDVFQLELQIRRNVNASVGAALFVRDAQAAEL